MKKAIKKSKAELDVLTEKEIIDYRYDYLGKMQHPPVEDEKIYLKEFEFYRFVRFKQEEIDTYNRWKAEAIAWEKEGKDLKDITYRSKALLKDLNSEELYEEFFQNKMTELSPFKFIQVC